MEGIKMSEANYLLTNKHIISNPNTQIMRVDLDGGFHVNESIPATDAAKEVLRIIKGQWLADAQATKIRELQSDVNELKELVEYLKDRVKKLKSVGNELMDYVKDGTSESNYRLLVDAWEKAKGKL